MALLTKFDYDIKLSAYCNQHIMEEVDVKWCKVWIVTITYKDSAAVLTDACRNGVLTLTDIGTLATGNLNIATNSSMQSVPTINVCGPYVPKVKAPERFCYLQKSLADKKVETLKAEEHTGYQTEVSMYQDIGWTFDDGANIHINNMTSRYKVNTE